MHTFIRKTQFSYYLVHLPYLLSDTTSSQQVAEKIALRSSYWIFSISFHFTEIDIYIGRFILSPRWINSTLNLPPFISEIQLSQFAVYNTICICMCLWVYIYVHTDTINGMMLTLYEKISQFLSVTSHYAQMQNSSRNLILKFFCMMPTQEYPVKIKRTNFAFLNSSQVLSMCIYRYI